MEGLTTVAEALGFAEKVGYPVLVRPSYVLSGAAMNVAWDESSLAKFLGLATDVSPEHPVVISKFIENSKEIEIDAVAKRGRIIYNAITEHIENAGVHSGDATVVLPAQRLYIETIRQIRKITEKIAEALEITGPFNIQFIAQRNRIKVIECNLRASRSFPFCSKVSRVNMIDMATKAILDADTARRPHPPLTCPGWASRRPSSVSPPPRPRPDSRRGMHRPESGLYRYRPRRRLHQGPPLGWLPHTEEEHSPVDCPLENKVEFLDSARKLTRWGTSSSPRGGRPIPDGERCPCVRLHWPLEKTEPNIATMLRNREFDLVINIRRTTRSVSSRTTTYPETAIDFNIPLFTNVKVASSSSTRSRRSARRL